MLKISEDKHECHSSKNNLDLLEINKSKFPPLKKTTSFDKLYSEYLSVSQNKNVEFSNSNFNPNNNNSPNTFINKLEKRMQMYYNNFK
mgnify:FL=1